MDITEVRIKLMDDPHDRLQAFCSVTFDSCFVIRDLKIIQGTKGSFVAMPSRKLTDRCPKCYGKNHLRAQYCNQCSAKLDEERATKDNDGRAKLYADIAHPINSDCRELIQQRVLAEYELELVRSKESGYVCSYDDYGEDRYATLKDPHEEYTAPSSSAQPTEAPVAAKTFTSTGDGRHRIEQGNGKPGAPHHTIAASTPRKESVSTQNQEEIKSNDSFGAGL